MKNIKIWDLIYYWGHENSKKSIAAILEWWKALGKYSAIYEWIPRSTGM